MLGLESIPSNEFYQVIIEIYVHTSLEKPGNYIAAHFVDNRLIHKKCKNNDSSTQHCLIHDRPAPA